MIGLRHFRLEGGQVWGIIIFHFLGFMLTIQQGTGKRASTGLTLTILCFAFELNLGIGMWNRWLLP